MRRMVKRRGAYPTTAQRTERKFTASRTKTTTRARRKPRTMSHRTSSFQTRLK